MLESSSIRFLFFLVLFTAFAFVLLVLDDSYYFLVVKMGFVMVLLITLNLSCFSSWINFIEVVDEIGKIYQA